jgi:ketosteroid isomerase-like protein
MNKRKCCNILFRGGNIKIRPIVFLMLIGLFFISCQTSDSELSETIINQISKEVEAIHNSIIQAFNKHDASKIVSYIDQSDNLHYVEHTQVTISWDTLKNGFEKWHATNQDVSIEMHQSYVNVLSEDVAVLVAAGVLCRGGVKVQKYTWTAVFHKKEGNWKIVNAHEAFSDL